MQGDSLNSELKPIHLIEKFMSNNVLCNFYLKTAAFSRQCLLMGNYRGDPKTYLTLKKWSQHYFSGIACSLALTYLALVLRLALGQAS